jgi:hypothetical protein
VLAELKSSLYIVLRAGVVDVRSIELPEHITASLALAETPVGAALTSSVLVAVSFEHPPVPVTV